MPPGLQLYTVREQMNADLDATLVAVHAAGFREVEAAGFGRATAATVRTALDKAGLRCVSAHHHFVELEKHLNEAIAFDKELGAEYLVLATPGRRSQGGPGKPAALTLDDWRYTAEQMNEIGAKLKAAGLRLAYHNHTAEFTLAESILPYAELMRICEPGLVSFELDCGWARVAGQDPVTWMQEHRDRFCMLHVKDFALPEHPAPEKRDQARITELGRGSIDYAPIFAEAARSQNIQHAFIEQESFDMPWKEALAIDAAYMKRWSA
ncbi:MAG: sugar phosphate isomerase/epimerase [Acidobacteria bacterium]|nr:sugar phosphate isomerase/epimerase [Acidobacteriota bacterium]